jgi:peptidyl-prolyl cis-trans isomerase SurA
MLLATSVPLVRPRHLFTLLGALAACAGAACRSAPAPTAAVTADTWAVVDGRQILRDEVEKAFRRSEQASQPLTPDQAWTAKLSVLNDLIAQDLLLARARALAIDLPQGELDTAYANARKGIPDEAFQQELTRRQLTPEDMREGLRRELLSQKVLEREVGPKSTVTDREVEDFFDANRAQFNVAEDAYRIAQIVVGAGREAQLANRAGDDATTPQAADAKVKMLMERLQSGASFSELAMDYSEDPESAPRGGDLGFVPASRLAQVPPALRRAVVESSPGSVKVVSGGGVHTLVLLVAHERAGQRDLSTPGVRDNIRTTLQGQRQQLLHAAYVTDLRGRASVTNYLARRLLESGGKMPAIGVASPAGR